MHILDRWTQQGIKIHDSALALLGSLVGVEGDESAQFLASMRDRYHKFFQRVTHKDVPSQIMLKLLRMCGIPKMNYVMRTIDPEWLTSLARTIDKAVIEALQERNILDKPVADEVSFNLAEGITHGGLGLRKMERIRKCVLGRIHKFIPGI